jgi:hypothetical protein
VGNHSHRLPKVRPFRLTLFNLEGTLLFPASRNGLRTEHRQRGTGLSFKAVSAAAAP